MRSCQGQLRVGGMGVPIGLDFGAVLAMSGALGCDAEMVAHVLPVAEAAILKRMNDEGSVTDA